MLSIAAEHILYIISNLEEANNCPAIPDPIHAFFAIYVFQYVFHFFDYSGYLSLLFEVSNLLSAFIFTYRDVFVIIISIGLSVRFKQINKLLMENKGKIMSSDYWSEYRIYYRTLCSLTRSVDKGISIITMASIANNLFFICYHLRSILR